SACRRRSRAWRWPTRWRGSGRGHRRAHEPRQSERDAHAQEPLELLLRVPHAAARAPRRPLRGLRVLPHRGRRGRPRPRPGCPARELARWREDVARCFAPGAEPVHPIARQLKAAVTAYSIPRAALDAIIEGCAMDLERVRYETAEELEPYCYRVASAVGLCCIEIFGYPDPRARQYAIDLGKALQLTNIMRDVGVDARAGRVYLPQRDLKDFGVSEDDLVEGRYGEPFVRLMVHQAVRARRFYAAARASYPARDARSLVAAEIM